MLENEAIMAFYGTWSQPAMVLDLGTRCAAAVATDFGRDLKVGRE